MLLAAFRWLVYSDGKGWLGLYLSLIHTHTQMHRRTHTCTGAHTHAHTHTCTSCSVADILLFSPLIGPLGVVRGLSGCLQGGNTYIHTEKAHTHTHTYTAMYQEK